MAKITTKNFTKTLREVTLHTTEKIMKISEGGVEYELEVIPTLRVSAITSPDEKNNKFYYSIVDSEHDLEYTITAPNKVEARFATPLLFKNVRGGVIDTKVWFAADSVAVVQRNA